MCVHYEPLSSAHASLLIVPVFLVPTPGAGTSGGALGGGFPYLSPPIIQVSTLVPYLESGGLSGPSSHSRPRLDGYAGI